MGKWVKVEERLPSKSFKNQQKVALIVRVAPMDESIRIRTVIDYFFNGNKRLGREPGFEENEYGFQVVEWWDNND